MKKRILFLSAFLLLFVVAAHAQDEINTIKQQLQTTNTSMRSMYVNIRNIIYVICGIVAMTVLPGKLQKMQSGDPDSGKSVLGWCGALVFVAVAAYAIQLIFFA